LNAMKYLQIATLLCFGIKNEHLGEHVQNSKLIKKQV
jgi:hypothetical protein